MDINSIPSIFNRALYYTFSLKKLFWVFCTLAVSGVLVVFFRGLAFQANDWVRLSLTFLPIFLCGGILLSMGIILIRIYYNEVKKKEIPYWDVVSKSWQVVIGASYFAAPIILAYFVIVDAFGNLFFLAELPTVGEIFGAVLSFAPFIINLGTLVLCLVSLSLLFFVAPIIALRGNEQNSVLHIFVKRFERDPFSNLLLGFLSLAPLIGIGILLTVAVWLTGAICFECHSVLQTVLKWFFMMLPFTAFLTPAIVFFFNFAAEAHVLMAKQTVKEN